MALNTYVNHTTGEVVHKGYDATGEGFYSANGWTNTTPQSGYTPPGYAPPGLSPVSLYGRPGKPLSFRKKLQIFGVFSWVGAIWFVVSALRDALNDPAIHWSHFEVGDWLKYGLCVLTSIYLAAVVRGKFLRIAVLGVTLIFAAALAAIA